MMRCYSLMRLVGPRRPGVPQRLIGRKSRCIQVLTLLAVLALPVGCSTRNDPRYNRYCPNDGDPTLMRQAESCVDTADAALDNAAERVENVVD